MLMSNYFKKNLLPRLRRLKKAERSTTEVSEDNLLSLHKYFE